jgi:hypothetical protein
LRTDGYSAVPRCKSVLCLLENPHGLSLGREAIGTDNVAVSTACLDEISRTAYSILRDVATSKLASDLGSGSKKAEPDNFVSTSEIYS